MANDALRELAEKVVNDVIDGKLKRKKLTKKKTFKGFLVALKDIVEDYNVLREKYEALEKAVEAYKDMNNGLTNENIELHKMLREYHRRSDPTLYPEETMEEIDTLEDLDDDDYDDLEREIYEESMKRWERSIKKESDPTTTITAHDAFEWLCAGLRHCRFDSEEQRKRIDDIVGEFAAVFEEKEEDFSELSKELKELLGENDKIATENDPNYLAKRLDGYLSASDTINMFKENPVDKDSTEESSNE